MIRYDFSKKHTATQALQEVHARMLNRFKINSEDVKKAQEMQTYLQYFKKIFANPEQYASENKILSSLGLEQEAIEDMRTRFQQILGVTSNYKQIFQSEHSWYADRKEFDDIVEGELNALLQVIAEKATGIKNINLGQKIVGQQSAIIDINELESEVIEELIKNCESKISKTKMTKILEDIKTSKRPGKIDVKGYSSELVVSANLNSNFTNFIKLFSGVNFSVKNYKGDNKYQIHLGSTHAFKAMYGALRELDYDRESAVHIYSHSMMSYKKHPGIISRNNDIFHLRFMYELIGGGLIDADDPKKRPLDKVDFLIYNDPKSDKIYVKSVQEMIADILDKENMKIANPWSGVYVSKVYFH